MFETERLTIKVLNGHELRSYAADPIEFAKEHHLHSTITQIDAELIDAINHSFLPFVNDPQKKYIFFTLWLMIIKESQTIAGALCFHGEPENGIAEIGYGVNVACRRQGYMTEALNGLLKWMSNQPDISSVIAETDNDNIASINTLVKTGFTKYESNESSSIFFHKLHS
jgi:[ribosomal protein S5]-alanine N-acetyltransferase